MTKDDKLLIYNLLKKADCFVNGYERKCFATEPVFQDDVVMPQADVQRLMSEQSATEPAKELAAPETAPTEPAEGPAAPANQLTSAEQKHIGGMTMEQLNNKIYRCTRCGLARTRNNVVPGEGVPHPDVFVIGEGPGYDEDMQGHPFVGKAGMLLDKMLNAIELDRHTNCFIGNIVKCRPPENRNPYPDEQDACFPFLETQIHILKPKMILCLGKVSIEKIMGQKISITANHGVFYDYNGIPVMVTYHPSALLRNLELKRPAWEDLKGFKRRLDEIRGL